MSEHSASAQEVRAVLAKWTANDWRRAFALAEGLERSIRHSCEVPSHEPLANNAGALAMPVLRRLGQLTRDELVHALAPLAIELESRLSKLGQDVPEALDSLQAQDDVGSGLAKLAACRLGLDAALAESDATETQGDLTQAVTALEEQQSRLVAIARQLLADAEHGRPVREVDLGHVHRWNQALSRAASLAGSPVASSLGSLRALLVEREQAGSDAESTAALSRLLREIADAPVPEGARDVVATVLEEAGAAAADPAVLTRERNEAFRALHRLLSQASWQASDADVEVVEKAFGRKVARVAGAEVTLAR
ncbi:MAG: hypothetical protein JWM02_3377 [Frankiales bacterium]|nr:hypothetical protein [Frankiales bacterium]